MSNISNAKAKWFKYVKDGNKDGIKRVLEEEDIDIDVRDVGGNTALIISSAYEDKEIVRLLVEKGANINDQNDYGDTALMIASYEGRTEIVKFLVEKGADINHQNKDGKTALDLAKDPEIKKMLLKAQEKRNEKSGQELAIGYEKMTGQSAKPGRGPANLIRKFAGIQSPRGYKKNRHGGSRKRRVGRRTRKRRL